MAGFVLLGVLTIAGSIYVSVLVVRQDRGQKARRAGMERRQELNRQYSIRQGLDRDCAEILQGAEDAVTVILASTARAENLLDPPVDEKLLRDNVQAILIAGQRVTELRARHRSIKAMVSSRSAASSPARRESYGVRRARAIEDVLEDSMTAAVLKPQQQALAMVLEAAKSRLLNLERYASSVKAVDAAYWDFIGAQEAERLNESVLDLLANTVRDKLAAEELKRLTERASMAEQAFRRSVHEANLAAGTLAFPDGEGVH